MAETMIRRRAFLTRAEQAHRGGRFAQERKLLTGCSHAALTTAEQRAAASCMGSPQPGSAGRWAHRGNADSVFPSQPDTGSRDAQPVTHAKRRSGMRRRPGGQLSPDLRTGCCWQSRCHGWRESVSFSPEPAAAGGAIADAESAAPVATARRPVLRRRVLVACREAEWYASSWAWFFAIAGTASARVPVA